MTSMMASDGDGRDGQSILSSTVIAWGDPAMLEVTLPRPLPGPVGPFFIPKATIRQWCRLSNDEANQLVLQGPNADQVIDTVVDGRTNEEGFILPPGRYVVSTEAGLLPTAGHDEFLDGIRIIPPLDPIGGLGVHSSQGLPLSRRQMANLTKVLNTPELGADLLELVPLVQRIRMRRVSPAVKAAVDSALLRVTKLCAEELAGLRGPACVAAVEWLVPRCPALTKIDVIGLDCVLTDASLKLISEHCKALTHLDAGKPTRAALAACQGPIAGDKGIAAIAEHCRELQLLRVPNLRVTDDGLMDLGLHARKLVDLCLYRAAPTSGAADVALDDDQDAWGISAGHGLRALARGCRQLQVLWIPGSNVEYAGLKGLADCCTQLQQLDISRCEEVTDDGLNAIAKIAHRLKYLNVSHCPNVSHNGLAQVLDNAPNLQAFFADSCPGVVPRIFVNFDVTNPKVHALCVARCPRGVTDQALAFLVHESRIATLTTLTTLDVSFCSGLTDTSISKIGLCKNLRYLNVSHCPAVTDASIRVVAENCKELQTINIAGCQVSSGCRALFDAARCTVRYT
eukprot:jgi/Mesvir1/3813/Mv25733-RA.1